MKFTDIIIIFILTFYSVHIIKMIFSKNTRKSVQITNIEMNKIRNKPLKTIEEQKRFINMKYPKMIGTFKFSWKMILDIFIHLILYIIFFRGYMLIYNYFGLSVPIWFVILFVIIFPILINYLLEKFNIQKGDLKYILKW